MVLIVDVDHLNHLTCILSGPRLLPHDVIEIFLLVFLRCPRDDWPICPSLCQIICGDVVVQVKSRERGRGMEDSCGLTTVVRIVLIVRPSKWVKTIVNGEVSDIVVPLHCDSQSFLVVLNFVSDRCCDRVIHVN